MCEPEGGGVPLGGVAAVAGIVAGGVLAVRVLAAVAPLLAALGAVTVVLGVASVPVLRWARRFSVVCLPAKAAVQARQTALPAGTSLVALPVRQPLALPPAVRPVQGVVLGSSVPVSTRPRRRTWRRGRGG